jgi:hypothetical protein
VIRSAFNADPNPAYVQFRIQGFDDHRCKKFTIKKAAVFWIKKLQFIYPSGVYVVNVVYEVNVEEASSHKVHPVIKEYIQHFKPTFPHFFSFDGYFFTPTQPTKIYSD